jgi:hypothetical protein
VANLWKIRIGKSFLPVASLLSRSGYGITRSSALLMCRLERREVSGLHYAAFGRTNGSPYCGDFPANTIRMRIRDRQRALGMTHCFRNGDMPVFGPVTGHLEIAVAQLVACLATERLTLLQGVWTTTEGDARIDPETHRARPTRS